MSAGAIRARRRWVLLAAAACCFALLASATAANAGPGPGPGLVVSAGSAKVTGSKLKGAVTVANRSGAGSGRFYLTLVVKLTPHDRLLKRAHQGHLSPGSSKSTGFTVAVPSGLPVGRHQVWACAAKSPAPSEQNGCRMLATIYVPVPHLSPPASGGSPTPAPAPPISTVPTAPIPFQAGMPLLVNDPGGSYWADVPASYNPNNQTPTALFVWLHGCGGESSGDIYTVSPETVGTGETPRDWISIAVGGREGDCWDVNSDQSKVLTAIADVETHFNIDRHRVILGGYSSGGDLSYRLAFYDAGQFAGVLAENTSPFRDTGSTESESLAAAAYKFHVVHLAHLQDSVYPIEGVREETNAMIAAGFPLQRIEVEGDHYDNEGEHGYPGTDADLIHYLLPHIDDGWRSP